MTTNPGKDDENPINTVCDGFCAVGTSSTSVIKAICKDTATGPMYVDGDEKVLTPKVIDTTHEKECLSCKDVPDRDNKFKWNCTLQVLAFLSF